MRKAGAVVSTLAGFADGRGTLQPALGLGAYEDGRVRGFGQWQPRDPAGDGRRRNQRGQRTRRWRGCGRTTRSCRQTTGSWWRIQSWRTWCRWLKGERFPAHRVLAARREYFRVLLLSGMQARGGGQAEGVVVREIELQEWIPGGAAVHVHGGGAGEEREGWG